MTEKQRIKYAFWFFAGSVIELSLGLVLISQPWGFIFLVFAYLSALAVVHQFIELFNAKVERINELEGKNVTK